MIRKLYCSLKDNVWRADLADMQLISKYNKEIRSLLCINDLFSKNAWIISLNDKNELLSLIHFKVL